MPPQKKPGPTTILAGDDPTPKAPLPDKPTKAEKKAEKQEDKAFQKWFDNVTQGADPSLNTELVEKLARAGWDQGLRGKDLRALFSQGAVNLFASNFAGGEGQPSPYVQFFQDNPDAVGNLVAWLQAGGKGFGTTGARDNFAEFLADNEGATIADYSTYLQGLPSSQESLFGAFPGLKTSYLASLGLQEVTNPDGTTKIVNPLKPDVSPYVASLLLDKEKQLQPQGGGLSFIGGFDVPFTDPNPLDTIIGAAQAMQQAQQAKQAAIAGPTFSQEDLEQEL